MRLRFNILKYIFKKNPFGLDEVSEISCKLYSYISLLPSYKDGVHDTSVTGA